MFLYSKLIDMYSKEFIRLLELQNEINFKANNFQKRFEIFLTLTFLITAEK